MQTITTPTQKGDVNNGLQTMSSRQIAELTKKNHADVVRDIKNMCNQLHWGVSTFADTYIHPQNGQQYTEYNLPRYECELLITGYDVKRRAAVIKRWMDLETGKEQPAKPVSVFTDLAKITEDKKALAELFGLSGNQALLSAAKATETLTGHNPIKLLGVELKSDRKEKTYTVTELGREFFDGMSAQKLNRLFEAAGLQNGVAGQWELTEKGKEHAEILDTGKKRSNGTPVKQIKWFKSVVEIV